VTDVAAAAAFTVCGYEPIVVCIYFIGINKQSRNKCSEEGCKYNFPSPVLFTAFRILFSSVV